MSSLSSNTLAVTGNEAGAEAMRQINPDVVCAYPITLNRGGPALRPDDRRRQGRHRFVTVESEGTPL